MIQGMSTSNTTLKRTRTLCRECKQFLHRCIAENALESTQYFERRPWPSHMPSNTTYADPACPICSALLLSYSASLGSSPTSAQDFEVMIWNSNVGECNFTLSNRETEIADTMSLGRIILDLRLRRMPGKFVRLSSRRSV